MATLFQSKKMSTIPGVWEVYLFVMLFNYSHSYCHRPNQYCTYEYNNTQVNNKKTSSVYLNLKACIFNGHINTRARPKSHRLVLEMKSVGNYLTHPLTWH